MDRTELAIVGAGFAGLACAQAAASRGVRVACIDRKPQAGARCHTTGILVKETADAWDVPRGLTRKVHGVRLYGPSLGYVDFHCPGYYFLATDAGGLLKWLADRARQAGASVRFGGRFGWLSRSHGRVLIGPTSIRCNMLIGADGPRSRVARAAGLGVNREFLVGVETHWTGVRGVEEDLLHVLIDPRLAPGYVAWVAPGVGLMQVGLAARWPVTPRMDAVLARFSKLFDFSAARQVDQRGGVIPIGGPVRPMGDDQVLLIGDAAGMVSPLTAGGIHTALGYGRAAGVAAADHLLDAGPRPIVAMRRAVGWNVGKRVMRWAYDRPVPAGMWDAALGSRAFRSLAQTVFYHHRGLWSPLAWRDIAAAALGRGPQASLGGRARG